MLAAIRRLANMCGGGLGRAVEAIPRGFVGDGNLARIAAQAAHANTLAFSAFSNFRTKKGRFRLGA